MGSLMRVDVATRKQFAVAASIGVGWLLLCIIIGAAGPKTYDSDTFYAYGCPGNSHNWDPNTCTGTLMNGSQWWSQELPKVGLLNRFFTVMVTMYNTQNSAVKGSLHIEVNLFGKKTEDARVWYAISENDTKVESFNCPTYGSCQSFLLIFEDFIEYPYYQVQVSFPNSAETYFLGDVEFKMEYGHSGYSKLTIAFRVIYTIFNVALVVFYMMRMKRVPAAEWTWEQRGMGLIIFGLLGFNNIVDPFRFTTSGWFFPFLSSLFEVCWGCSILLFWLMNVDKIRRDELQFELSKVHIPKIVIVFIYGVLSLILYAYFSIRDQMDPVYGTNVTGIQVMFYLVSVVWTGIIIWIIVLGIMTIPIVSNKNYLVTRFLFFSVPTGICILSILIGIFAGNVGPLGRSTLSFMYFMGLFNVYVYFLFWGYFPAKDTYTEIQGNEEAPLYYNFGSNSLPK